MRRQKPWYFRLDQRQAEVFLENTSRATLILNIDRIDLYMADDNVEGAWEVAKEAYNCAMFENEQDLIERLLEIFPKLHHLEF